MISQNDSIRVDHRHNIKAIPQEDIFKLQHSINEGFHSKVRNSLSRMCPSQHNNGFLLLLLVFTTNCYTRYIKAWQCIANILNMDMLFMLYWLEECTQHWVCVWWESCKRDLLILLESVLKVEIETLLIFIILVTYILSLLFPLWVGFYEWLHSIFVEAESLCKFVYPYFGL